MVCGYDLFALANGWLDVTDVCCVGTNAFTLYSVCACVSVCAADFGVSAKNKKTANKRATFIGTPYW